MVEDIYYQCEYRIRLKKETIELLRGIVTNRYGSQYADELSDNKIYSCTNVRDVTRVVMIKIYSTWLEIEREFIEVVKPKGKVYITHITEDMKYRLTLYKYYDVIASGYNGYYLKDDNDDTIFYKDNYLEIIDIDNKDSSNNQFELIDIIKRKIANIEFSTIDNNNKFMLDKDNRLIIYLPEEISSKCNKKRLVIDLNSICVIDK